MIREVQIENYKSIEALKLDLGRFNVFIGENGAGKSNILEAMALAGAAEAKKLDNEFLASRGIRVTSPRLMRTAFGSGNEQDPIRVTLKTTQGATFEYTLNNDNKPYSSWTNHINVTPGGSKAVLNDISRMLAQYLDSLPPNERVEFTDDMARQLRLASETLENAKGNSAETGVWPVKITLKEGFRFDFTSSARPISEFVIYSPENSALREFEKEGQIEPLGVNGEGLFKLLQVLQLAEPKSFATVRDALRMLNWFDDMTIVEDGSGAKLRLSDCFVNEQITSLDHRSANEGFVYVAFYFALMATSLTPKLFAIDNIDASLNPRLCEEMTKRIALLAKKNRKQVILTTHNPAVLDGIDLSDNQQRLFIVSRSRDGKTKVRRFSKKVSGELPSRLSELFLRGNIGGLPKSF